MSRAGEAHSGRISVVILALGGQGGGVLADWIREVAAANAYVVQATSVPGVAQRTGSTIYYLEMIPACDVAEGPEPVLALMPSQGDVDIALASELMEGGRAMLRGFVTADRTTLISSTHRIYTISEKVAAGDGRLSTERIIETARKRARRFIGFDMEDAASRSGALISSVMLGALAGSGALPFPREAFEDAVRRGGKSVEPNLRGFAAGLALAATPREDDAPPAPPQGPTTEEGRRLLQRIRDRLPPSVEPLAQEGVRRLMDYQDVAYAELYLDRLERIRRCETAQAAPLTAAAARWIALWMAYEDVIRVADLKVRATRSERIVGEVNLSPSQVLTVTEYLSPRLREVCDILPVGLGRAVLRSRGLRTLLEPLFAKGRHVETTSVGWFGLLSLLAGLRPLRRFSLRYAEEQARLEGWLRSLEGAAIEDPAMALELAEAPRLLKGYGDTWDRSLARFEAVMGAAEQTRGRKDAAARVRAVRTAALADDGDALCPQPSPLVISPSGRGVAV